MATLVELTARRDQIIAQMTGPSELRFNGRMVVNRPMAELQALLERTQAEIAALESAAGGSRPTRIVYLRTNSGHR